MQAELEDAENVTILRKVTIYFLFQAWTFLRVTRMQVVAVPGQQLHTRKPGGMVTLVFMGLLPGKPQWMSLGVGLGMYDPPDL